MSLTDIRLINPRESPRAVLFYNYGSGNQESRFTRACDKIAGH